MKKALKRFNLTEDRTGFPWHTLASDRGLWKSLICPDSFYNRVSRSDIAEKVNNPHTHTTPANTVMEVFSFELVVRFPEIAQASSSLLGCCNHHHQYCTKAYQCGT